MSHRQEVLRRWKKDNLRLLGARSVRARYNHDSGAAAEWEGGREGSDSVGTKNLGRFEPLDAAGRDIAASLCPLTGLPHRGDTRPVVGNRRSSCSLLKYYLVLLVPPPSWWWCFTEYSVQLTHGT